MWNHKIFGDIIQGENDFVGMVAYSIYKQEKVNWVKSIKQETGKYPEPEEVDKFFHVDAGKEHSLQKYREQAQSLINMFVDFSLMEHLEKYEKDLKDERVIKTITDKLEETKKEVKINTTVKFWRSLRDQILTGFTTSLITIALTVLFWLLFDMNRDEAKSKFAQGVEESRKSLP